MATTTNYGWTTPDDTALVKDGASAIRTLGTSVDTTTKNLNPQTTLGDIAYRSSSSNVNTRLGIGSTGQVLTVAAGVPSWATPATSSLVGCQVKFASDYTIATGTNTVIPFTAEEFDTNTFHDNTTNNSRITIPTGQGGYYLVYGMLCFDASATGVRNLDLKKNGSYLWETSGTPAASSKISLPISIILNLAAADYLELSAYQTSGANRIMTAVSNWFGVVKLG